MWFQGRALGLFTESTHQLIATVRADETGHFEFKHVKAGRYRLVATAEGLCTANVPLIVLSSARHKEIIIVHFRPRGMDSCSYGELAMGAGVAGLEPFILVAQAGLPVLLKAEFF
jgi:hypothetical protein